jgi:hypothetical protein
MNSQNFARNIFLLIVVCTVSFAGEAPASPESKSSHRTASERIEYATSLNSIASTLMNWYGSLITTNGSQLEEGQRSIKDIPFLFINKTWQEHRATYPEKISSIQIMNADMNKQDSSGLYQFDVEVLMTTIQAGAPKNKIFHEVFIFKTSDSSAAEIKKVTRLEFDSENSTPDINQTAELKTPYYKSREFAYAWLAYMDGVKAVGARINSDRWLDKAHYSVKIGDFELDEKLTTALKKRNDHIGKGGHLLRSVTAKELYDKPNRFELDIIIDWKGTDPSGLPAIAKINQIIQYELQEDGSWLVLFIKEKHMLPDLHPWQKILC